MKIMIVSFQLSDVLRVTCGPTWQNAQLLPFSQDVTKVPMNQKQLIKSKLTSSTIYIYGSFYGGAPCSRYEKSTRSLSILYLVN